MMGRRLILWSGEPKMSQLVIDVSDLLGAPGSSRRVVLDAPALELRVPLGGVDEGGPVTLNLVVDSVVDGVALSGRVSGEYRMACVRCLTEYREKFSHEVDEIFRLAPSEEDDYRVSDGRIDLEPMLRDIVVLAIPTRPLHDPDCKGLCPTCGADRNLGDCGHSTEPVNIRWAPLADLLSEKE